MKIKEVLEKSTEFLRSKKIENPRFESEILIANGLQLKRIDLYLKYEQPLQEAEVQKLRTFVQRRGQGEPSAYITGTKGFYGFDFVVGPAVLIPRPETETLIDLLLEDPVLDRIQESRQERIQIVDLGSGSGCLGLSLLKKIPNSHLLSVDISADALEIAKTNAKNLNLDDRVQFVCSDANEIKKISEQAPQVFSEKIDILVSNPPYIAENDPEVEENVKKFEPQQALFAQDQGLALLKSWSQIYGTYLQAQSLSIMEMGYQQGSAMKAHFQSLNIFDQVYVLQDLNGRDRFIKGVKNG